MMGSVRSAVRIVRQAFDIRGFLIALLIISAIFSGYAIRHAHGELSPRQFDAALVHVEGCVDEENPVACAEPFIERLLDFKSGGEIMDVLSTRLTPAQCHYIGHVVGQQSFIQSNDLIPALAGCNRACDSACVHGAVGEAFVREIGYDPQLSTNVDFQHLGIEELRGIGRQLCLTSHLCHGVGHTLFQIYGEIGPAIAACREVAPEPMFQYCTSGLFMEYADILSDKHMRSVSGIEHPDVTELNALCNWAGLDEMRSCFRYFPRIATNVLENEGFSQLQARQRIQEICESYRLDNQRIACFAGIGTYSAYNILADQRAAIRVCENFPLLQDKAACYAGQVSVAMIDRQEILVPYCSLIVEERLRFVCYQGFFHFFDQGGGLFGEAGDFCQEENRECMDGFREQKRDTWGIVLTDF